MKYEEILNKIGTPSYVFDIDVLKERLVHVREKLSSADREVGICYAMKANPFVVGTIDEYVDNYEVCSPGEFKICEKAGADIGKVVLSGVLKDEEDVARLMERYGDRILYTAESESQFMMVNYEAEKNDINVDIILRITTGNQFGMDERVLRRLISRRNLYKGVSIAGIQHFSGTQRHNMNIYKEELEYCDRLIESLNEDYGFETQLLEFGTGFYVEYFRPKPGKESFDEDKMLSDFACLLNEMRYRGKITLEIGRFIAASCGRYYTAVADEKVNDGKHFCIADGGIHQVNYFGQMMAMKLPYYRQYKKDGSVFDGGEECKERINLCGALCTINDNLVKDMPVCSPEKGDIFEFMNTGAYSMTETPALFLSRDIPRVWLYSRDKGLVLMRERFETNVLNGGSPMRID